MPVRITEWTPDEVRELIDEERPWPRYELIDGELLVTSAPAIAHQRIVGDLYFALRQYVDPHHLGEALISPADIQLDAKSILQPDVFVIPPGVVAHQWADVTGLLLAVEVISPSSARYDRVTKRRFFQRHAVPEYWVVDGDAQLVERWRPSDERPEILTQRMTWQPDATIDPLEINLDELFARATR